MILGGVGGFGGVAANFLFDVSSNGKQDGKRKT